MRASYKNGVPASTTASGTAANARRSEARCAFKSVGSDLKSSPRLPPPCLPGEGRVHEIPGPRVPAVYPISRMGTRVFGHFVARKAISCTRRVPDILNGYTTSHQTTRRCTRVPTL